MMILIFSVLHFFSELSYCVYYSLWVTAKYVKKKKGNISLAPRSLQLVGLNLLTSKLQLGKLLFPLVGLQRAILYSGRAASANVI